MSTYGAAVGADIARYLVGQEDWAKLVTKLGEAFTKKLTDMVYAEVMNAYQQIPVSSAQIGNFVGNGTLVKVIFLVQRQLLNSLIQLAMLTGEQKSTKKQFLVLADLVGMSLQTLSKSLKDLIIMMLLGDW